VCPHQGSRLNEINGKFICPYHSWSFDQYGTPLSNGNTRCANTENLTTYPVYQVGNFLFDTPIDFDLEFLHNDYLTLEETRVDTINAPVQTIMDLFLDVEHIPIVHKNIYEQIGISGRADVSWQFKENGSLQLVKSNGTSMAMEFDQFNYGAAWLALYPNTMIEWQPGAVFITEAYPFKDSSKVFVYKYRDTRYSLDSWNTNQSIWETAWAQDKAQSEKIVGINNKNLEEYKQHYNEWCKHGFDL
jgi:phenylpropionate dioxygenase-like ring-hydroxylating dioxygenase large terminal subunit